MYIRTQKGLYMYRYRESEKFASNDNSVVQWRMMDME